MQYTGAGAAASDHGRIVRAGAPHCGAGDCSAPHYRAATPPLLEPALQQSIKTILSISAYLSASAASIVQGRWIYHKPTGPTGECPAHPAPEQRLQDKLSVVKLKRRISRVRVNAITELLQNNVEKWQNVSLNCDICDSLIAQLLSSPIFSHDNFPSHLELLDFLEASPR